MPSAPAPPTRTYADRFTDSTRWNAYRPRIGDIVVVTSPKSGTTWTQAILALLISGDPDRRDITVYRHPSDVFFSFLKHARNGKPELSTAFFPPQYLSDDPAEGFHIFLQGDFIEAASLRAITGHTLCTLSREQAENPLRLHYAGMLRDLPGAVAKIAAHVGITQSPKLMAQLVGAATFDSMKTNAAG